MVVHGPADTAERTELGQCDRVLLLRENVLLGSLVGMRVRVLSTLRAEKLQELSQLRESLH